ncbi:hypothetical protein GGR52DRAFT_131753 [Hypoxylon sp. FL1284]|nr:hypothetical protein GGR52DRAFT_131753 [Hypoxylon sp. FL1284]
MPSDSEYKPRRDKQFWKKNFKKRPNYQGNQKQVPTRKVHGDPWQSFNAIQLGFKPRSFEKLHVERLYLLKMLQQHDERAFDLFKRVPDVDDEIRQARTADEKRKAQKHRTWLRNRIGDIVEEEKNILTRLSELHVEVQCRERWLQVERARETRNQERQEQYAPSYTLHPTPPAPPPAPFQPLLYYQAGPPVPFFYPYYPPYEHTEPSSTQAAYHEMSQTPGGPHDVPEDDQELGAFEMDGTPVNHTSDRVFRRRSASDNTMFSPRPKKRMSMPSIDLTSTKESDDLDNIHTSPKSIS